MTPGTSCPRCLLSSARASVRAPHAPWRLSSPARRRTDKISRFATSLEDRLLNFACFGALHRSVDLKGLNPVTVVVATGESGMARCPHSIALTVEELGVRGHMVELPTVSHWGPMSRVPRHPVRCTRSETPQSQGAASHGVLVYGGFAGAQVRRRRGPAPRVPLQLVLPPPWGLEQPVEQNTCYRVNWGAAQSCDGWRSRLDEETGLGPC
ncbi:hypothetical protein BDA96_03G123600 [Sorghum bicolor]|uniref:Uncharacterized protein n=2 Tax=Sorghum bicolor TaxID=4558 RepID=A0A1W0VWY3_SORBI|nr:hypothetical protein BDA96_03G123600 [Sorghum bicolor]OQU86632.1 hypothetical protein SORBI_3003G118650 [Sorghum bicolor]